MLAKILLVCALLIGVADNICRNTFAKKIAKTFADGVLFSAYNQLFVVLALALMGGFVLPGKITLVLSFCYGLVSIVNYITYFESMKCGPLYATVIINTTVSSLIPCLLGVFLWKESISIFQIIGAVLMFASVLLVTKWEVGEKPGKRWYVMAAVSAVTGGGFGVVQQAFNRCGGEGENIPFLFYAFLTAATMTFLYLLFIRKKEHGEGEGRVTWKPVGLALALTLAVGVLCFADNVNNLWLVSQFPAVVFFIICSGGRMILSTAAGAVFFKERMSALQITGAAVGVLAVIFISGVFG